MPDNNSNGLARQLKGNLFILIATIFFGVNLPVVKVLIPHWMTSMDVSAFRMFGGCALMWLTSLFLHNDKIQKQHWRDIILGGAVGLFSFIFLFNLSIRLSNPIDVSIIMTLPPAFVMLINMLFKGSRPSRLEMWGLVISFIGAFIVIALQHGTSGHGTWEILGDLLALLSSLCYAFYLVVLEVPMKTYKPVSMLRWVYLVASIPSVFLIPGLFHAPIWHTTQTEPWLLIGFVVLCPTFLSYFLMAPAMKLLSSELVSIYQYLVPVVASVTSVILKVADINWIQVVAMIVIVGGMVLSNVGKFRRSKRHADTLRLHGVQSPGQLMVLLAPDVRDIASNVKSLEKTVIKIEAAAGEEMLSATGINAAANTAISQAKAVIGGATNIKSAVAPYLSERPENPAD